MTKIPSKCVICKLEFPSMNQMKVHKAAAHPTPSKPPGPPMKAKEAKKKTPVRNVKTPVVTGGETVETTASPKLPASGSAEVMSNWINGAARASQIAAALAAGSGSEAAKDDSCQDPRSTGARPKSAPTVTLDESVSLLENAEVNISNASSVAAPGPRVSTLTVFPPEMEAVPLLDEGSGWILRPRQAMIEPEPEKGKRTRERYEDDSSSVGGKKLDERSTPEEVRANTSRATANPRNLDSQLANSEDNTPGFLNTQEVMEVEFDSQSVEWDIEGHNVKLVSRSEAGPSANNTTADTAQLSVHDTAQLSVQSRMMSTAEQNWMSSNTFSTIPPSPVRNEAQQDNDYGGDRDTHDLIYFKNAKIEELTMRLEEQMSNNQDHLETVGTLENKISELQAGVTHYRTIAEKLNTNAAESCSKLQDEVDKLKREVEEKNDEVKVKRVEIDSIRSELNRLKIHANEKEAIAESAALEVESVKAESLEAMNQIHAEVIRIEAKAKADMEKAAQVEAELIAKYEKLEGEKRAQIERLTAINKKALNDMGKMQAQYQEIADIKAALVKAEGDRDLERLRADSEAAKAAKSDEMLKNLEAIMKDTQEEKAKKENTNSALRHKIKIMTSQIPCEKSECDFSCGKDHHCGTPTYRPRRRSRSRNNRDDSNVPTTANLASQAGVTVERMEQLVQSQTAANAQGACALDPKTSQNPRMPPKPRMLNSSGVEICRNFHYQKICVRGPTCRYAHELIPANRMKDINLENRPQLQQGGGRVFNQAVAGVQRQQQTQQAQAAQTGARPRSRSTGRPANADYMTPHYHWDHPDYERIMAMRSNSVAQPAGNANGQRPGASPVQNNQPQNIRPTLTDRPLLPRPRTQSTSAASETEARMNIRDSMEQQASASAQARALRDNSWRNAMDNVLNLVSRAYTESPEVRTPSRTSSASTKEPSGQNPGQDQL